MEDRTVSFQKEGSCKTDQSLVFDIIIFHILRMDLPEAFEIPAVHKDVVNIGRRKTDVFGKIPRRGIPAEPIAYRDPGIIHFKDSVHHLNKRIA